MKKKILSLIVILSMLIGCLPITSKASDEFIKEGCLSFTIPDGFDYAALIDCDSDASTVIIPNEVNGYPVESISANFCQCNNLTYIYIPENIKSIHQTVFRENGSGKLNIEVSENNPYFSSVDGVLFDKNKTRIIAYKKDKICSDYIIPNSVKSIEDYAFSHCENLTNIEFSSVETIGSYAFYFCSSLSNIFLPESVNEVSTAAFRYCTALERLSISKNLISIQDVAFSKNDSLTDVYYNGSEEQWNKMSIGKDNESLTNATIYYNSDIRDLSVEVRDSATNSLIPNAQMLLIDSENNVKSYSLYNGQTTLNNTVFPIYKILVGAIGYNTSTYNNISYPSDGKIVFTLLPENNPEPSPSAEPMPSPSHSAEPTATSTPTISPSTDPINTLTPSPCTNPTNTPSSTTEPAPTSTADPMSDSDIIASGEYTRVSEWKLTKDGTLYITPKEGTRRPSSGGGGGWQSQAEYEEYLNSMENDSPWSDYTEMIKCVDIAEGIRGMYECAFTKCVNLTDVSLPSTLYSIPDYTFLGCTSLESIDIPDGITAIGDAAFYGCTKLADIKLPDSIENIYHDSFYNYAFYNTPYYNDELNWENGSLYIGKSLIAVKPSGNNTYKVKDGTRCIAEGALYNSGITSIEIPDSIADITIYTFDDCNSLTDIYYKGSEEQWNEFYDGAEIAEQYTVHFPEKFEKAKLAIVLPGAVKIKNPLDCDSTLIVTQYEGDAVKKIKTYPIPAPDRTNGYDGAVAMAFYIAEDFENIAESKMKAMLWDSLEAMRPLADAVVYNPNGELVEYPPESQLGVNEQYGWIMDVNTANDETLVRLYTADNEVIEAPFAAKVDYFGPENTESTSISKDETEVKMQVLLNRNDFLKTGDFPIRLVKYKLNYEGAITRFYLAVDETKVDDTSALRINKNNLYGYPAIGGAVGKYLIKNGITEFNVPQIDTKGSFNNPENYSVGEVDKKNYVSKNGSSRNYIVGEFDNMSATVIINYTVPYEVSYSVTSLNNTGNGPTVVLATSDFAVIPGDDDKLCKFNWQAAGKPGYLQTVSKRRTIAQISDEVWSGRMFQGEDLWSYAGSDVSPAGLIEKGDVVLNGGYVTAKYISASKLYDYVINGTKYGIIGNRPVNSLARVSYYCNALTEKGSANTPYIEIKDCADKFFIDENMIFDLAEVNNSTGEITVSTAKWSDLVVFDEETKTGDYLFIASGNGNVNRVIVYRFTDGAELAPTEVDAPQGLDSLSNDYKYGWIMGAYTLAGGDGIIKIYTQDNEIVEFPLNQTVDYWASGEAQPQNTESSAVVESIQDAFENKGFLNTSDKYPIRLVKYRTNSINEIKTLYCAVDCTLADNGTNALTVNPTDLYGLAKINGGVNNYFINDNIIEFNVPNSISEMQYEENYSIGKVNSSDYAVRVDGSSRNYVVGGFVNGCEPTFIINFTRPYDYIASFEDLSSVGEGPKAMVVDSLDLMYSNGEIYDMDSEAEIEDSEDMHFRLNGFTNGKAVSFETNTHTNMGQISSSGVWAGHFLYGVNPLWNVGKGSIFELADYVRSGDLVLYSDDGELIAKYISVQDLISARDSYKMLGYTSSISTRAAYYFNMLEYVEIVDANYSYIKLKNTDKYFYFPTNNTPITLVEIRNDSGRVTVSEEPIYSSDLCCEDEFAFVSTGNGKVTNITVYRFID